ncbi:hypothetical protein D3C76_1420450 [compost metagenome]
MVVYSAELLRPNDTQRSMLYSVDVYFGDLDDHSSHMSNPSPSVSWWTAIPTFRQSS